jgi:hypothetical protein
MEERSSMVVNDEEAMKIFHAEMAARKPVKASFLDKGPGEPLGFVNLSIKGHDIHIDYEGVIVFGLAIGFALAAVILL